MKHGGVVIYQKTKINIKVITFTVLFAQFVMFLHPLSVRAESSYVPGMECYNANGWSASKVIHNVSQWYGINPQVILATLQKEQSLITTSGLNQYGLDWAMGYGVPDGGNRDYSKQGFAVQVDWGSWQLKWNMNKANSTDPVERAKVSPYITGNTISIDGVSTLLTNGSTASLYRYTPHFHGNQNFRGILNLWFDEPDVAWDATHITEDVSFANSATMSEQQIQDFLVAKGSYLANYTVSGNVVLGADSYRCPIPTVTNVYRFWNNNGTHFYTASESERDIVVAKWPTIYRLEGVAYKLNTSDSRNNVPLYRFYNMSNGTHFYTASDIERDDILRKWGYKFRLDGVAYFVAGQGTPVYRFWNTNGTHFYTASEVEKADVMRMYPSTFKYEGIAYYIN